VRESEGTREKKFYGHCCSDSLWLCPDMAAGKKPYFSDHVLITHEQRFLACSVFQVSLIKTMTNRSICSLVD
jgi:hypothetical protein